MSEGLWFGLATDVATVVLGLAFVLLVAKIFVEILKGLHEK